MPLTKALSKNERKQLWERLRLIHGGFSRVAKASGRSREMVTYFLNGRQKSDTVKIDIKVFNAVQQVLSESK